MELKSVIYTNEKGNVKATVRNAIKEQVLSYLQNELEVGVLDIIMNERGGISIPIAVNSVNEDIVYAEIEIKVNTIHPDIEKKRAKKKVKNQTESGKSITYIKPTA